MKPLIAATALLVLISPALAIAQSPPSAEMRDSAVAFLRTQRFIVGRLARDCLETIGSKESPRSILEKWDKDNAKYVAAVDKYWAARLEDIQAESGAAAREERDTVLYVTVERNGTKNVGAILAQGDKVEVCKAAMTSIESGKMDVENMAKEQKMPVFGAIDDLVEWAKTH